MQTGLQAELQAVAGPNNNQVLLCHTAFPAVKGNAGHLELTYFFAKSQLRKCMAFTPAR